MKGRNYMKKTIVSCILIALFIVGCVPTNASSASVNLTTDMHSAMSDIALARNYISGYYSGKVSATSNDKCTFGLYACDYVNGSFKYCESTQLTKAPGKNATCRTISGYKFYKVKIVPGSNLIADLKKKCIASATCYGD